MPEDLNNEIDQKITDFRNLLKDHGTLKNLPSDDDYLRRFLYSCDLDIERAFEKITTFHELLIEFPEWFTKDSPLNKKEIIEKDIRLLLPGCDKKGRPVYIIKIGNQCPQSMDLLDIISVDQIILESILDIDEIRKGLAVIVDISNLSLRQMKWATPHNIKLCLKIIDCYPIKEFEIHVIKSAALFNLLLKLVLPFMSDKMKKMIKFHYNEITALQDYIDPEILPVEYGGIKKIDPGDFYTNLYKQSDKIVERFTTYRTI